MLNLLLGRALLRWLVRMGAETATPTSRAEDVAAENGAAREKIAPAADPDPVPAQELAYPRVQRRLMGSLFEVYLAGTDREALTAAGEAALDEVERLERQLSHFRDDSDVARLNAHAADQWVRLEPRMYALLKRCREISLATDGAFEISTGPLTRLWGFHRTAGTPTEPRIPTDEEIAATLEHVGIYRILFEDTDHMVYYTAPGLEINLGAIGKGYAIDAAVETLRMYGVESAVIHGGQSTIYALGEMLAWTDDGRRVTESEPRSHEDTKVSRSGAGTADVAAPPHGPNIRYPIPNTQHPTPNTQYPNTEHEAPNTAWHFAIKDPRDRQTVIEAVMLRDEAISTSGGYEQFFEVDGVRYGHVMDPRTGRPVPPGTLSVSVVAPTAEESDALSTAFYVMGAGEWQDIEEYCGTHPNIRVIMLAQRDDGTLDVRRAGAWA